MIYAAELVHPNWFRDFLESPYGKELCMSSFEHADYFNRLTSFDFDMEFVCDFEDASPISVLDKETCQWGLSNFKLAGSKIYRFDTSYGSFIHINTTMYSMNNGVKFTSSLRELDMRLLNPEKQIPLLDHKSIIYDYKPYLPKEEENEENVN